MSFKDIKGQNSAVSFLSNALVTGRVGHAYLFLGPSGVGRKLAALNLAKALNCLGKSIGVCDPSAGSGSHPELVEGCDVCGSCKKIDASGHPDIVLLRPEKPGASIKIDDIRALTRSINLKPYEARVKVCIIDDAEALGHEAENALLKTLEEPPPKSVLILIAQNARFLSATVVSRLQTVRFFAIGEDSVKDLLVESHGVGVADARILARLSSGRIGEALRYKDGGFAAMRSRILGRLADGTLFDSDLDRVSKTDLKIYLGIMLTWYRDVMVVKAAGAGAALLNSDKHRAISLEAEIADFGWLERVIKQIVSTMAFLDKNVNAKLAMGALGGVVCTK